MGVPQPLVQDYYCTITKTMVWSNSTGFLYTGNGMLSTVVCRWELVVQRTWHLYTSLCYTLPWAAVSSGDVLCDNFQEEKSVQYHYTLLHLRYPGAKGAYQMLFAQSSHLAVLMSLCSSHF